MNSIIKTCDVKEDLFLYHQFLYMHTIKIGINHRLEFMSNILKNNYCHSLSKIFQITEAVHLEIKSQLFYVWKGFKENPHGMEYISQMEKTT